MHSHINLCTDLPCTDLFKVQDTLIDCSVTEDKKSIDKISDCTSQLTFKKLPLVKCWCSIKEEYPQLSEGSKNSLPFSNYRST